MSHSQSILDCSSKSYEKKNADEIVIVPYRNVVVPLISSLSHPRKRNKSQGLRIMGTKIFDSENGKSCHQCHQKTMDLIITCKSPGDGKTCIKKYCDKCLLNRYGEKAEAANQLEDWKCPRCRGICNCSICLKKWGLEAAGSLRYKTRSNESRPILEINANGPILINSSLKRIERMTDYHLSIENIEEKVDEIYNGGEEISNMRKKSWKKLARAKNNAGDKVQNMRKKNWKKLARAKNNENATSRSGRLLL